MAQTEGRTRQEPLPRLRQKEGALQQAWRVTVQNDDGVVTAARLEWRAIESVADGTPDVEPLPASPAHR